MQVPCSVKSLEVLAKGKSREAQHYQRELRLREVCKNADRNPGLPADIILKTILRALSLHGGDGVLRNQILFSSTEKYTIEIFWINILLAKALF